MYNIQYSYNCSTLHTLQYFSNFSTNMSLKRKAGNELSIDEKKEVLDFIDKGASHRNLAYKHNVSVSTISNIRKQRDSIMALWEGNCSKDRQRKLRQSPYEELNKVVFEFFLMCRAKGMPISGPILQEKSRLAAATLGISDFTASNGWLAAFRHRNNIDFRAISGEARDADSNAADRYRERIPAITDKYAIADVFNADETGLFFKRLPDKSLALRGEKCVGGKFSKERITVLLACSASGEKLKPFVIRKSLNPRAFRAAHICPLDLPVIYRANSNAWMTGDLFYNWLLGVNTKMKKEQRFKLCGISLKFKTLL